MWVRRASRRIAPTPTMSRTRVAATLFELLIIGASSALSPRRRRRWATEGRRRYAASSITLKTLAIGALRLARKPRSRRSSPMIEKETAPARRRAYRRALATPGDHSWAAGVAAALAGGGSPVAAASPGAKVSNTSAGAR